MEPEEEGVAPQEAAAEEGAPGANGEGVEAPAEEQPSAEALTEAVEAEALETTVEAAQDAPADGLSVPVVGGGIAVVLVLVVILIAMARGGSKSPAQIADNTLPSDLGDDDAIVEKPRGLAPRLLERMSQSRAALRGRFDALFGRDVIDESALEELEEALLIADVGVSTTDRIMEPVREALRGGQTEPAELRGVMQGAIREVFASNAAEPLNLDAHKPFVLLVVGVNGSGKTTSIGKLAAKWTAEGKSVLLAAGDTYRAAAGEQLEVWADRAGATIVRHAEGADPGAVVYDALEKALAQEVDVVIIDTAGRLQTARPLMEQLSKVRRVIQKKVPDGPHETFLVVDGTMGQNALSQGRSFHEATPLSGAVVTKLDGTAKGGMVLGLTSELGLPIRFIGIGEQVDDLRPFESEAFIDVLT